MDKLQKLPISAELEHINVQIINFVHPEAPDEADLHSVASVLASAIDTYENTVVDADPLGVWLGALYAEIVHVPLHFVTLSQVALLALKEPLSFHWRAEPQVGWHI